LMELEMQKNSIRYCQTGSDHNDILILVQRKYNNLDNYKNN
ncbi:unnamed protein product, partial [marine sediment metagenome]